MTAVLRSSKLGTRSAVGLLGLAVIALAMIGTRPASADPTLFVGNLLQQGGINLYSYPVTTAAGPQGSGFSSASNTPNGFTIPANAFDYSNPGYTFSVPPVYPYVLLRKVQRNLTGNFSNGYFTPSVATTKLLNSVSTMVFPTAPLTPRDAEVRLVPGPQGLGGPMTFLKDQTYLFQIQGLVFLYEARAGGALKSTPYDTAPFGQGLLTPATLYGTKRIAQINFDPGRCCTTRVIGEPTASASGFGESAVGPWATGMLYVTARIGADSTDTTNTGVDSRSAFDSGVISLVSPRVQFVYDADGTGTNTIIRHRESFAVIQTLDFEFIPAPEPGTIVLIAGGVFGLVGLTRIRRRI